MCNVGKGAVAPSLSPTPVHFLHHFLVHDCTALVSWGLEKAISHTVSWADWVDKVFPN